ncbi:MAG: GntR family transcriptional regulator [Mangrovicoccus sp.]
MSYSSQKTADWVAVFRGLKYDIERGAYSPGEDLPTISGLAKLTGLTKHGARRAMEKLCAEGLAQSWQGKGFRVTMPRIRVNLNERKPVFAKQVQAQGFEAGSQMLSGDERRLPPHLADRMECRAGTTVLLTETLRKVNGCNVALSVDYFRKDRLDGIIDTLRDTGSVSQSLALYGVHSYSRDRTLFETRLPSAHEALILGISRLQPVSATIGANLSEDGSVLQISQGIWRGDCVIYEV